MRIGYLGWSIDVLQNWSVTEHPECFTVELSDEGALQLSSASKKLGLVTEQDLEPFSDGIRHGWGKSSETHKGEFSGFAYFYVEGSQHWARWFLQNGRTLLFATYNGSAEAMKNEIPSVEQMLNTLLTE